MTTDAGEGCGGASTIQLQLTIDPSDAAIIVTAAVVMRGVTQRSFV